MIIRELEDFNRINDSEFSCEFRKDTMELYVEYVPEETTCITMDMNVLSLVDAVLMLRQLGIYIELEKFSTERGTYDE